MAKLMLLVTLIALVTRIGAFSSSWSSSSESDSAGSREKLTGIGPTNITCVPHGSVSVRIPGVMPYSAYLDGNQVNAGSKVFLRAGKNCVLSFLLDTGSQFNKDLWTRIGNRVTGYRCYAFPTTYTRKKAILNFNYNWPSCNLDDSSWPIAAATNCTGGTTLTSGSAASLLKAYYSPIFCRGFVRCGPRAGSAPPPPGSGGSTTPAPPPSSGGSATPGSQPTTTPSIFPVTTSGAAQTTTTFPPVPPKCDTNMTCYTKCASSNYNRTLGQSFTININIEGYPEPSVQAIVVGSGVKLTPSPSYWIPTTYSTYQFVINVSVVDFTVEGPWNITAYNHAYSNVISTSPTFSLDVPAYQLVPFVDFNTDGQLRKLATLSNTVIGTLFQTDFCTGITLYFATSSGVDLLNYGSYLSISGDAGAGTIAITGSSDAISQTSVTSPAPEICTNSSKTNPVWIGVTLDTSTSGSYTVNVYMQKYMPTTLLDPLTGSGNPLPTLVATTVTTMENFGASVTSQPDSLYFYYVQGGLSAGPSYWIYK